MRAKLLRGPRQGCRLNRSPGMIALLKHVIFNIILELLLSKVGVNRFISVAESDGRENVKIFTNILEHCAWEYLLVMTAAVFELGIPRREPFLV